MTRAWDTDIDANGHALENVGELTMADSLTGVRDFEGDHLRVDEDGSLHASSRVTFHDVDDYGADPTGEEPSDGALDAAIEAAEDGDWIALTNGTYYLADRHEIRTELLVYGAGGVIESDCNPDPAYDDVDGDGTQAQSIYPIIAFSGERGESVSLTGSAREGDDQVPVEDASPFEVGGGVLVNAGEFGRAYYPTVSTIREIAEDTLFLDVPLRYDYDADETHNVYPLEMLDNCGFVECHFRNRHELHWDEELGKVHGGFRHAMHHQYCRRPLVVDCSVAGYDTKAWVAIDVLEALVTNIRVERPTNVHGQHAEPLYMVGSTNISIYNPVIRGARRPIDLGGGSTVDFVAGRGGCKDVNVYNPDITGVTLKGLSYHHGSSVQVSGNLNVYGGRVHCRPTDATVDDHGGEEDWRWEYHRGRGTQGTRDEGRLYVHGTEFVAREHGAMLSGTNTTLTDCTFTTVPAGRGIASSGDNVGGSRNAVLYVAGENVTVQNATITANSAGTDHTDAVYVAPESRNVDVDVHVRGTFGDNAITVDGGKRVRLRARLSDADANHRRISIGGPVEDLSLSGSGHDGGHVVFREDADATNVTVHEYTHRGEHPAIRVEEGAAIENLRLRGVTAAGEANHFDFGGAFVDGLWVKDCIFDELRGLHPNQETAEHTFIADNRSGWSSER